MIKNTINLRKETIKKAFLKPNNYKELIANVKENISWNWDNFFNDDNNSIAGFKEIHLMYTEGIIDYKFILFVELVSSDYDVLKHVVNSYTLSDTFDKSNSPKNNSCRNSELLWTESQWIDVEYYNNETKESNEGSFTIKDSNFNHEDKEELSNDMKKALEYYIFGI